MKIEPAVDVMYSEKGSARGIKVLELIKEKRYRKTHVADCKVSFARLQR
jgi:hypothetical protein